MNLESTPRFKLGDRVELINDTVLPINTTDEDYKKDSSIITKKGTIFVVSEEYDNRHKEECVGVVLPGHADLHVISRSKLRKVLNEEPAPKDC